MKQLYKVKKASCLLLIIILYVQQTYSQDTCFTEKTVAFHKELKNKKETIDLLMKGAAVNHAYSIHSIGLLYVQGSRTVPVDFKKAYTYFEKSAHLGIHNSMRSLGILWRFGDGREVDFAKAYGWYRLAGDYVPTDWDEWHMPRSKVLMFKRLAPNFAKKMTPEQIKKGDAYYKKIKSEVKCNFNSWLRNEK